MDWGNAFVKTIKKEGEKVVYVELELNLDGDFKKTKKKLTWLCSGKSNETSLTEVVLLDYDYLITKKKLEEDDTFEDCVNKVTEFKIDSLGDLSLRHLKKGDIIQLERKGFYICDKAFSAESPKIHLILIPDGKAESVSLKARSSDNEKDVSKPKSTKQAKISKAEIKTKNPEMYDVDPLYKHENAVISGSKNKMYAIESIYGKVKDPVPEKKEQEPKAAKVPKADPPNIKSEGILFDFVDNFRFNHF